MYSWRSLSWCVSIVLICRVPDDRDIEFGELKQGKVCMDTLGHLTEGWVSMYECHGGGGNQEWALTKNKAIRHMDMCLVLHVSQPGSVVKMEGCSGQSNNAQSWEHTRDGLLRHKVTGLCMDSDGAGVGQGLVANQCEPSKYSQRWEFSLNMRN